MVIGRSRNLPNPAVREGLRNRGFEMVCPGGVRSQDFIIGFSDRGFRAGALESVDSALASRGTVHHVLAAFWRRRVLRAPVPARIFRITSAHRVARRVVPRLVWQA